ncbi:YnbE family lipoprotein [uncultured Algimonas sp.]|uniref:YnbE family lipoprotein n=1 Tax=uncultured Algimonas sp. TaxID=1547920 RepID=UPI002637C6EF|nr:YnbE family lipoprotein [uncultured Algimonas sp.]
MKTAHIGLFLAATLLFGACRHQVEVIAPKEPIQINLAIKIDQEVRVRLEQDIESLIANNPDLF